MVLQSPADPPVEDSPKPRQRLSPWQRRTAEMRAVGRKLGKKNLTNAERLLLLRKQATLADKREATLSRRLPRDL